jgi:radical SAM superfamily enzyme YgiQ (UPF0313 family)
MLNSKSISVLLILPRIEKGHGSSKNEISKLSIPPLTLPYIAGITPSDIDVSIIDENVDEINFDKQVDLVGISVMTMAAPRAYQIADSYKKHGVTVVLGGIHPTMLPEEASSHADAIVIGEAEGVWQELLADFQKGIMRKVYRNDELCNLNGLTHPRWDLVKKKAYFTNNVIQTSRGCPHSCSYCIITKFYGGKYRSRPIEDVIKEIEAINGKFIAFIDADITGNYLYAKRLFEALIPYKKIWAADAGIGIAKDDRLLNLAAKSGCKGLLIGFESLSPASLQESGKSQNIVQQFKDAIDKIHQHGIMIVGQFMFGFDNDDESIFERTVEFAIQSKIDFADFNVLCPYPGTRLYNKLREEGRITETDWSKYRGHNVVFQPKQMSAETLENGCIWAWKQFHSYQSILTRYLSTHIFASWVNAVAYPLLNISTKIKVSKFDNEYKKANDSIILSERGIR